MRLYIRFLFLITISFFSCHHADRDSSTPLIIRMDPGESRCYDLDSLFSEYRLVPLETRFDCLVGYLRGIQMLDDRILVLSNTSSDQELLFFDSSGKFLTKTTKGQGPGEVINVQSFYADTKDQSVWVANNKFLQQYNSDGKYLGRENSTVFNILSLLRIKKAFYMTTLMGNVCCVTRDSLIWQIESPRSDKITGIMSVPNLLKDHDNPMLFSSDFRTLYKLDPDTLLPILVVDFGPANLPLEGPIYNMRDQAIQEMIASEGYVSGLSNFQFFEGGLLFTGGWKNQRLTFIHLERSGTNRVVSGLNFGFILNTFPDFSTYQDRLVCNLSPDILNGLYQEFKTKATSQEQLAARKRYSAVFQMLDTLDINANPVLLVCKMRGL